MDQQTPKRAELERRIGELSDLLESAQSIGDVAAVEVLIDEIDALTDEFLLQEARRDPNAFIEYCFSDKTGKPLRQSSIHKQWQASLYHPDWNPDGSRRAIIVAPRDHGKTTQIPVGRVLWELGVNPNLRIKIACQSDSKAMERLFEITDHLERNDKVRKVFPHLKPAQRGDWCVPIDSLVQMSDGRMLRIDEISVGDSIIGWCAQDREIQTALVEHVSDVIPKPCVQITTDSGRSFRASIDHRMLSYGEKYRRAGNLFVGDPVAIGRHYLPSGYGPPLPAHESRLLGYLVGDGYTATKNGGPWFTNGDQDILDDFSSCARAMGWGISEYADRGSYKMLGVIGDGTRQWLDSHGLLGSRSGDKRIPPRVLTNAGSIAEFMSAYFACDGCMDVSVGRVCITTMSTGLARDVMHAMRIFGIAGRLTPDRKTGAWKVGAAGWDGVEFASMITTTNMRCSKLSNVVMWSNQYKSTRNINNRQSDLWHEVGGGWRGGHWRRRKPTDPTTLGWERVIKIEDLGVLPCIDYTIAEPVSTFLLDDGFVAHNTKHKVVVNRMVFSKDASIEALGILSTATGGRADLLIADDIVDRRNAIQFPQIRETIKHAWKSDWTNLLEPDGRVAYICTLWHTADNSHELMANAAYSVLFHAVSSDFKKLEAWKKERGNKTRVEWEEPLWDHWSEPALVERKEEIGQTEFDRAFRNIALSGEVAVVHESMVGWFDPASLPEALTPFQGFDLAISRKQHADYYACVTVCADSESGRVYVMDAYHARLSFTQQAQSLINEFLNWNPAEQVIEVVSYQDSLPQYLDAIAGKPVEELEVIQGKGTRIEIEREISRVPLLPITKMRPTLDKMSRLKRVTPYLERGLVLFHPKLNPRSPGFVDERGDLVTELLQFPLARNDDLADAFVNAVLAAFRALAMRPGDNEDGPELDCNVRVLGAI